MQRTFSIILCVLIMSKVVFSLAKFSRISSSRSTTKSFQRSFSCNSGPNKRALLEGDDRTDKLKSLDGWKVLNDRDAIQKTYLFKDFIQAFGWMSEVAIVSEEMDHHPEWLNCYNKVEVTLSTHHCKGLSKLDIDLANIMDELSKTAE